MIAPSGVYSDKGTTALRDMFLNHYDWQWLFSFENRDKIFDIHRSLKFCPLVLHKGRETQMIRAAFMHRNIDDWEQAERHVLAYPRKRLLEFSPYSRAVMEIRSEKDLQVLQKIYASSVLLGDKSNQGWGIEYGREFDTTNDSRLFPPRPKWEKDGYVPDEYGHWLKGHWQSYNDPSHILERQSGLVLSRDRTQVIGVDEIEDVALPVYNAKMFDIWDFCSAGWVSGKGRGAVWEDIIPPKAIRPEYLMGACDYYSEKRQRGILKLVFKNISSAISKRTMVSSSVPYFPAVHAAPVLSCQNHLDELLLQTILASFPFDYVAKFKIGYINLSYNIIAECPIIIRRKINVCSDFLISSAIKLGCGSYLFSDVWCKYFKKRNQPWQKEMAATPHERIRIRAIIDAIVAQGFDMNSDDIRWIFKDVDHPLESISSKPFTQTLDQKRFWRIDRDKDPELRHPVLSLVAFHDLQEKGLENFLAQNDGEGWMIPDTLRLADYGLGHDDRAKEHQPVAERLGPRFYDWQLNQDIERSWQECEAHAELIRKIVPPPKPNPTVSNNAEESQAPNKSDDQGKLF